MTMSEMCDFSVRHRQRRRSTRELGFSVHDVMRGWHRVRAFCVVSCAAGYMAGHSVLMKQSCRPHRCAARLGLEA